MAKSGSITLATQVGDVGAPSAKSLALAGTRSVVLPLGVALAVLLLWEFGVRLGGVPEVILPAPSRIFTLIVEKHEILLKHAIPTTLESAGGFLIASALGIGLAILLTYSAMAREALYPNLVFFQLIPKIALAPLFIMWLGIGSESRLAFSVFISIFPIVIATIAGFAAVDPNTVRLCRSLTASEWQIFTNVRFPSALPYIFSGMKIAMTLAIIGVIIGEFITSQRGLGYLIIFATARADTVVAMAAIVVLCLAGLVLYGLVALAEKLANRTYGVPRG
jgi:NitT/TauT family transport system permease protein